MARTQIGGPSAVVVFSRLPGSHSFDEDIGVKGSIQQIPSLFGMSLFKSIKKCVWKTHIFHEKKRIQSINHLGPAQRPTNNTNNLHSLKLFPKKKWPSQKAMLKGVYS